MPKEIPAFARTKDALLRDLKVNPKIGLTLKEVLSRQKIYGVNALKKTERITLLDQIKTQIKSPLVLILLIAGLITLGLGEFIDAIVISIALLINVVIGITQEGRAIRAFDILADSQERYATVVREDRKVVVFATELVPGDIVVLEAGSFVPADVRIITSNSLSTNESSLTGEWVSVVKFADKVKEGTILSDRTNMAYMGTLVSGGSGTAVVVSTGSETEVGQISESLSSTPEPLTPIQKSLKKLANFLSILIGIIVAGVFILGVSRGEPLVEMLVLSIAVAISVLPEGLPAAVTVVLAIGMESILSRGGLVKSLLAAETLGSTTIILTDKTGTLTEAKMKLKFMMPISKVLGGEEETVLDDSRKALRMAVLSSDAFVERESGQSGEIVVRGRPIEQAIVRAGFEEGLSQTDLEKTTPQIDFLPFSPETRLAASLNESPNKKLKRIHITGAPGVIMEKSSFIMLSGKKIPMTDSYKKDLLKAQSAQGAKGRRLIAVAYKDVMSDELFGHDKTKENLKQFSNLVFGAFMVFEDPLRSDVKEAISTSKKAGARVIMVTGDNKETARAIAIEAGIAKQGAKTCEGYLIDDMSDKDLRNEIKNKNIFARVLPRQKLRIVRVLREDGEVVSMTGDGINDAPALRRADIGVAIGTGTEVAKEASDLILLNNSFSIIVAAIEEGRRIIDNLKKIVSHLLSTSFSEVFVISGALILGFPLPILAVQVLWLNVIEEGLLSLAFAFEPVEDDVMERDPRESSSNNILTKEVKKIIFMAGTVTGTVSLALFVFLQQQTNIPIEQIRTIMFVALSLDAIFFSIALKNMRKPIWKIKLFSNRYLIGSLSISILVLVLTFSIPALKTLLSLATLPMIAIPILIGIALINLLTIEWAKRVTFWGKSSI